MNGGQIITEVLMSYGVQQLFTLSGGHIAPIYVEAEKVGIKIIDVRHEASTVFAADALARMSGIPGVAVVTAGPGVTNTITALKNAQLAESPVLLLGGAAATLLKERGALQDIDQLALVRPHVKYAVRVSRMKYLRSTLHRALDIALSGVPGPVFVECPMDLLYEEKMVRELYGQNISKGKSVSARLQNWYIRRHVNRLFSGMDESKMNPGSYVQEDYQLSAADIKWVTKTIELAERPVILIGSGAMKLVDRVNEMAIAIDKLGIPVYLSGMARGLLGSTNSLQYYHERTKALKESDCVILAGVPCDFRLNYGRHFRRSATILAISRNKRDLKKNLKANKTIQVDPALFFIQLSETDQQFAEKWAEWRSKLQSREQAREDFIQKTSLQDTKFINPIALLKRLETYIPDNSVIIVDGGDFAASASYTLRPRNPLKWLDPGVFGTLGSGGGFALGAALKYPDHYIWIVYGDGSAAYSLMEMDTFRKFGMKVCGIIGNNGSWEQIARDQIHILGRNTASTLPQSNYEMVAHAFDAGGERVEDLHSFDKAVKSAMDSMDLGIPYVINALIGSTDFRKGSMSM